MRFALLFLCCIIFSNILHAQQLQDSLISYTWSNNQYHLSSSIKYKYKACKFDSIIYKNYFGGNWMNSMLHTFTYYDNKQEQTQHGWQNNNWLNQYRFTTIYHSSGKIDSSLNEQWQNNKWDSTSLQLNFYNASGLLTTNLTQFHYSSGWLDSYKTEYTYDADGNISTSVQSQYNSSAQAWEPTYQQLYTYNPAKKVDSINSQKWNVTAWINDNLQLYNYDALNRLTTNTFQSWSQTSSSYTNTNRLLFSYNGNSSQTSESSIQIWQNNNWQSSSKSVYTYIDCFALPLTLSSFTAARENNKVHLSWQTANETDITSFVLQRSVDGVRFTNISSLPAQGRSEVNNYATEDNISSIAASEIYYRLQIVSKDGNVQYSDIKTVKSLVGFTAQIAPNPVVGDKLNINLYNAAEARVSISLWDLQGKKVHAEFYNLPVGNITKTIQISKLPSGVYLLRVDNGKMIKSFQIIKQ